MKFMLCCIGMVLSVNALASVDSTEVIYGEDNRVDLYEVQNPIYLKLAAASAGLVKLNMLKKADDGSYNFPRKVTLEEGANLCSSEKYSDQPMLANCSGFLVAPNIMVSAGHCYKGRASDSCETAAWVFGLAMEDDKNINLDKIPADNVYHCKQVIVAEFDSQNDYAIIELDRPVVGREPVKMRTSGKLADETPLVVVGHPTMMPLKIADGGTVLYNGNETKFITTLDTFHGNSGSGVFNALTGELEGILVSGKTDYIPSDLTNPRSCKVVNTCSMEGGDCTGKDRGSVLIPGEAVTRITTLLEHLPK